MSSSTYNHPEVWGGVWRLAEKQYSRKAWVPEGIFDFIFNIISRQKLNTVFTVDELVLLGGSHFPDIYFRVWAQFMQIRIDIELRCVMTTHKKWKTYRIFRFNQNCLLFYCFTSDGLYIYNSRKYLPEYSRIL